MALICSTSAPSELVVHDLCVVQCLVGVQDHHATTNNQAHLNIAARQHSITLHQLYGGRPQILITRSEVLAARCACMLSQFGHTDGALVHHLSRP